MDGRISLTLPPARPPSRHGQCGPVTWHLQSHAHGTSGAADGLAEAAAMAWLVNRFAEPGLRLSRSAHGRPLLHAGVGHLDASWSHSGAALLVAAGRDVEVGIDMEWLKPRPHALELATRFFTPAEAAWIAGHAPADRTDAFIRLWCAKEAVLKAYGRGLAFGLHRLEFVERDGALVLEAADAALGNPADWQTRELQPAPGYVAAIAWRDRAANADAPRYWVP